MTLSVKVFRRTETETVFVGERVLDGDVVTIGRGSTCTLQLPDPGKALSRVQVELSRAPGGYRMTVASQYFPVIVNDRSHEPGSKMMIFPGDSIVMDVHELEIVSVEEAKAPAQVPAPNVAAPPPVVQRPARAPAPPQAPARPAPPAVPALEPPAAQKSADAVVPTATPSPQPGVAPRRNFAVIGAVAAAVVVAAGIGFAVMKGMGPGGDSARKVELDAARLDGEARSLLKLFDNDRRDLKEATAQSGKDIERLEGQVRAARTPQEKAPLEAALREARDKANAGAELEKKFRDRTEGPEGLPKAEGNLNAAAVAVKGKDGAEGLRMLGETVASLTALRAAIGEDRKAMQANLQRLSEQRKVEEPQPAPKVEMRAEPKAVPRPTPAQAASRDEAAAKAREAADAKAKAQADSKAAAQAEAKSKAESATRDKADAAAKAKSDAETRANARAAPKVDTKAKAEADASAKADADAKVKTEAEAKAKADAQAAEKAAKDAKLEQYKRLFQQQR